MFGVVGASLGSLQPTIVITAVTRPASRENRIRQGLREEANLNR
ncbi:MAG: hypothetical protein ACK55I_31715 [bacterium]